MDTRTKDELSRIQRQLATMQREFASIPVQFALPSTAGVSATMLLVYVNKNVPGTTAPFTVDSEYFQVVFGSETRQTITINNRYAEAFSPGQYLPVWKWQTDGNYEPDRSGAPDATMVVVEITTMVPDTTDEFDVAEANYRLVFGAEDRDPITVKNVYSELLLPNVDNPVEIPCWRGPDGKYEPDRNGAIQAASVVGFRLEEDLTKSATIANAELIDRAGSQIGAIAVSDEHQMFVGRGPFTDPLGSHPGYQGFAVRTDDYNGGRQVYRIISMEGPLRTIAVWLAADENGGTTPVTPIDQTRYGWPFNGRFPEAESGTGQFQASDPYEIATGAKTGDAYLVSYSSADDEYHFTSRLERDTMVTITFPADASGDPITVAAADYAVEYGIEERATISLVNTFNESFVGGDKIVAWKRNDGQYAPDRAVEADPVTMLYAELQSNRSGTFTVGASEYEVVLGSENRPSVTVTNLFGESFDTGDKITIWKKADGNYELDRGGTGDNEVMLHITLPSATTGDPFTVAAANYRVIYGSENRSTINVHNVFGENFNTGDKLTVHKRNDGDYEPDRGGQGGGGTMIVATAPSHISHDTSPFTCSTFYVVFGTEDGETVDVINTYGENFTSGKQFPAWRRTDGYYEPDRRINACMIMGDVISTVYDTDATFSVNVDTVVFGVETRASVTVSNIFDEAFESGDLLPCWRHEQSGIFYPDRGGGESKALEYGTAVDHINANQTGTISTAGGNLECINKTNRPVFVGNSVTVDRRNDTILTSNAPTAIAATAATNSPATTGAFTGWQGVDWDSGSVNDSNISSASAAITDLFSILQFVRAGDEVAFFVRSVADSCRLVPVQMDVASRHYEKLSWICGLPNAGGSEEILKVLAKPVSPTGELCDPKWFDLPPGTTPPDSYYETLWLTWYNEYVIEGGNTDRPQWFLTWLGNLTESDFVVSNDSLTVAIDDALDELVVTLNFTKATAKFIDKTVDVADDVKGATAAEEACEEEDPPI